MKIKYFVIAIFTCFVALAQAADPVLVTSQNVLTGFTAYKEGICVSFVGDFNGDNLSDYAVGVPENTGGTDSGSVFFVNTGSVDGLSSAVAAQIKLAQLPGVSGLTLIRERLGASIATLKPFQGAGTKGVFLVGTSERSRMWMMEVMYSGGAFSVTRAYRVDSLTLTNSTGMNLSGATLGSSIALIKKKGREYIVAVGASTYGASKGAVAILGIDTSFSSSRVITYFDSASAPFKGRLDASDFLGMSIASLGDLDGDGGMDLAVGAPYDDDDGADNGAVYELFLDANYAYQKIVKISRKNALGMGSDSVRYFGKSLAGQYDFDHDGVNDLVVGASQTPMSTTVRSGSIQILSLDVEGTVLRSQMLLPGQYGLASTMVGTSTNYNFAFSLAIDDLDYNGMPNLIVGTTGHNGIGGYWNLQLKTNPWIRNKLDTIELATNSSVQLWLDTLMIGSGLSYSIGVSDSGTTSVVRPSMLTANRLLLQSFTIRSVSKVVVKAEDSVNPTGFGPYAVYDTFYVRVSGPNQAPVFSPKDTVRLTEDGPIVAAFLLDTLFKDGDDGLLTYSIVSASSKVTATINSNMLTITPLADSNGVGTIVLSAKDKIGPVEGTVYFSIASVNDAPVAKNDSIVIDEDVSTTIAVLSNDADVDGQTLSVGIVTPPKLGKASVTSGQVLYVPNANANGKDTLYYFISDGLANDTAKVVIRIFPVDDAPIIVALDTIQVNEDAGPFTLLDLDTIVLDVDREAFARGIGKVTPSWASAVLDSDNVLTMTTQKDSNGVVAIRIWGEDFGGMETGMLYVNVRAVEDNPESIVNTGSPIHLKVYWLGPHKIQVQLDSPVSALYVVRPNGSVRTELSIRSNEKKVWLSAERGDLLVVKYLGKTRSVRLF